MERYDSYYSPPISEPACPPYPDPDNDKCKKCQKHKECCLCQSQTLGDLSATQGDQSQGQGDLSTAQGDLAQLQGDLSAAQGNLEETLGDMYQLQGGEKQGDQTQGITGHEGQEQGGQAQGMTGHGGQTQGGQLLHSNPSISTPVNVSGVNVNVTVSCCDELKKHRQKERPDCQKECRNSMMSLLSLINILSQSITDPTLSQISVYYAGEHGYVTQVNLNKVSDCIFTVVSGSDKKERTFLLDSLEALLINQTLVTPDLFELLLSYLQSLPDSSYIDDLEHACNNGYHCCYEKVAHQLQGYYIAKVKLEIFLAHTFFTGFIYKISNNIVYLVNALDAPTIIFAIPICKILSYQPYDTPL